jgi:hypothetical protein
LRKELQDNAEAFVQKNLRREIKDLLQLNRQSFDTFISDLLADRYTWLSAIAGISAVVSGHAPPRTAAALALMAAVGPPAVKSAIERRRKLRESDFSIVYRIAAAEGLPGRTSA